MLSVVALSIAARNAASWAITSSAQAFAVEASVRHQVLSQVA